MQKFQRNIRILFLGRIFGSMHFDRGIFLLYLLHSGITDTQVSILQITIFLVMMVMEVPSGIFADSYGRKASMWLAIFCLAIYAFGMIFADDFWLFFILFVIQGSGFAFYSGAETAMLYDSLKAMHAEGDFVRYNSLLMTLSTLALALAIGLGGYLQEWGGWTFVYSTYFATLLTSLFFASWLIEPPYDKAHQEGEHESYAQKIRELRDIFADGRLTPILYFILGMGLFEAMIIPLYIYAQELLSERGLEISQVSFVYGAIEGVSALCFLLAPYILRRWGAKRFLQATILFTTLCVALLAIDSAALSVVLLIIMFSWPEARRPIEEAYFNARIPSHIRASLLSLDSMIVCLLTAAVYAYYAWGQGFLPLGIIMSLSATLAIISLIILRYYFQNELPEREGDAPNEIN